MKSFKEDMKVIAGACVFTFGCVIGWGSTINGILGGVCMYFGLKLCGIDLLDVFRM